MTVSRQPCDVTLISISLEELFRNQSLDLGKGESPIDRVLGGLSAIRTLPAAAISTLGPSCSKNGFEQVRLEVTVKAPSQAFQGYCRGSDPKGKHHWSRIASDPARFKTELLSHLGVDEAAFEKEI
jgi:hypothetical protein